MRREAQATAATVRCLCGGQRLRLQFTYTAPPEGETHFPFSGTRSYYREIRACERCGHLLAVHDMDSDRFYQQEYVSATYGEDGIRRAFDRIIALDPAQSDNFGRVRRVLAFAEAHFASRGARGQARTILDVGSGLCVFLHRMRLAGWRGTAIDPDPRSVVHARETVGVEAICGDFMQVTDLGRFDVVSFNKVLEHVLDPVAMLAKALRHVEADGFAYVEVPDGEVAQRYGSGREEFFIDHWHIFSAASVVLLARRAGFDVRALERLHEPSGKYTLRVFLVPVRGDGGA